MINGLFKVPENFIFKTCHVPAIKCGKIVVSQSKIYPLN